MLTHRETRCGRGALAKGKGSRRKAATGASFPPGATAFPRALGPARACDVPRGGRGGPQASQAAGSGIS